MGTYFNVFKYLYFSELLSYLVCKMLLGEEVDDRPVQEVEGTDKHVAHMLVVQEKVLQHQHLTILKMKIL